MLLTCDGASLSPKVMHLIYELKRLDSGALPCGIVVGLWMSFNIVIINLLRENLSGCGLDDSGEGSW